MSKKLIQRFIWRDGRLVVEQTELHEAQRMTVQEYVQTLGEFDSVRVFDARGVLEEVIAGSGTGELGVGAGADAPYC